MLQSYSPKCAPFALIPLLAAACGDSTHSTPVVPWAATPVEVHAPTGEVVASGTVDSKGCIYIGEACVSVEQYCNGAGELVLDAKQQVVGAVCYPAANTITPEAVDATGGEIAHNLNDTVLVLDGVKDGADLTSNVHVDGNNVVIYGEGPLVSELAGDLAIDGNNVIVRGVRIDGSLSITKNNPVVAFSTVVGSVEITSNNARLVGVDILEDLKVSGNNVELVSVHVAGKSTFTGKNTKCDQSTSFTDANADGVAESTELGAPLGC